MKSTTFSSVNHIDDRIASRSFYEPFTAQIAGFLVPMFTGLLSACSSGLIIYIISKSQEKLSTTYHRIMAFMSAFDMVSSICIALGTIMVPSDTMYKFAGPVLGNRMTCQIQGWFLGFGIAGCTSLNASLAVYFVLKISLKVDENIVQRYVEPVMYCFTLILAIFVHTFFLYKNIVNPSPFSSCCTIAPYPESCDEDEWYDWRKCTWDDNHVKDFFRYMTLSVVVVSMQFMIVFVCMVVILWTSIKRRRPPEKITEDNSMNSHQVVEDFNHTRVLLFQALMYIAALLITWILTFVSELFQAYSFELDVFNHILFPLQGFWNLLIFLYDKTYLIRTRNTNTSFWAAVKMILFDPTDVPVLIMSNISMLETENEVDDMGQDGRISQDESAHYSIPIHGGDFIAGSVGSDTIDNLILNIEERSSSSTSQNCYKRIKVPNM